MLMRLSLQPILYLQTVNAENDLGIDAFLVRDREERKREGAGREIEGDPGGRMDGGEVFIYLVLNPSSSTKTYS